MRILTFSKSAWDNSNSTGNTFSNLFQGYDKDKIAHLYLRDTLPNNEVCVQYFSINERMILKSFFQRQYSAGHSFVLDKEKTHPEKKTDESIYSFFRGTEKILLRMGQNLFWTIFRTWKSKKLERFLNDFQPDIIFLENLEAPFLNKVLWHLQDKTKAKVVIYHTDNYLTYRNDKSILKKKYHQYMAKLEQESTLRADLNYGITSQLADLYKDMTGRKMEVLHKGADFNVKPDYRLPADTEPIMITYIGSVLYGRWETLGLLAKQIEKLNTAKTKFILNIYSQFEPTQEMTETMVVEGASNFLGQLQPSQIEKVYAKSDIVLHVESLDFTEREHTKMSFSTKIIDLLGTGRAILAIGWEEAASIDYFIKNDAAFVANNNNKILDILKKINQDRSLLPEYAYKAWQLGSENHQLVDVQKQLYEEFRSLIEG